jgi:hypothetical protein
LTQFFQGDQCQHLWADWIAFSARAITALRPHRLFGAVCISVVTLHGRRIYSPFSGFVMNSYHFRQRIEFATQTSSVTRWFRPSDHYSWLTQEKPDMMLGVARCCYAQSFTGHNPVSPVIGQIDMGAVSLLCSLPFQLANAQILA